MITLNLTKEEFSALCGLLDAGVRATGLRSVKDAAVLLAKFEAAETSAKEVAAVNAAQMAA